METQVFKNAINRHCPELIIESFTQIIDGQHFFVFEVNKEYIFRFVQSENKIQRLKFEMEILPQLKNCLPVLVPNYIFSNFSDKVFSFGGYKKIEGIPFNGLGNQSDIDYNAKLLGEIITSLNSIKLTPSFLIEAQIISWREFMRSFIFRIKRNGLDILNRRERKAFEEIIFLNENSLLKFDFIPSLIHADFKKNHMLCNMNNRMIGLIDWGDSTFADISFDFARILNEFGYDFLLNVRQHIGVKLNYDLSRIAIYTMLIPFLTILRGLKFFDEIQVQSGIEKLKFNLQQYSNFLK